MEIITLQTLKPKQIVTITGEVQKMINEKKFAKGIVSLFVRHTTAALTTADLDPGTDLDMLDAFEAMAPKLDYRHPHDPQHAPDHIMSSLIGPEVTIHVDGGKILLGTWQEIILVEFNGPRERQVNVSMLAQQ